MKLPAIQFYPADWRKDPGVQSLDYFDRGVWFEILCLMHESPERGKLMLNGEAMPDEALARILGLDNQTLTKTLTTLLKYGVASRDQDNGALMNRRMVKDETLRQIRTEAGKKGGNPALLNQKPTTRDKQKSTTVVKQFPTPSSSTTSSAATDIPFPNGNGIQQSGDFSLWKLALGKLMATGTEESAARSFLGKLAKDYGKTLMSQCVTEMLASDPIDPKSYLVDLLKRKRADSGDEVKLSPEDRAAKDERLRKEMGYAN